MKTPAPTTAKLAIVTRREFLNCAAAGGLAVSVMGYSSWAEEKAANGMIYRTLGSTVMESESLEIIRSAIDRGITFMDNCWDYHEGKSEVRMGKALRDGYRDKVFLMTKIDGRSKTGAAAQIEESLRRLQTDHVDLLQFHEIILMDDPDRIFVPGGALEAVQEAKKAGKLRYIGFTGHKDPSIHLHMLQTAARHQFRFDTVQMPLNVMDAHYRSFEHQVLPVLLKEQIGVLGMKSMGSGDILKSEAIQPIECLHYALNLPTSVVINGIDSMKLLDQAFEATRTFKPMSSTDVTALLARTAEGARDGRYELFKTATQYDSTSKNPEYLK